MQCANPGRAPRVDASRPGAVGAAECPELCHQLPSVSVSLLLQKGWERFVAGREKDADWILKAMIAVAAADGRLNASEVGLIQKVYQDRTGRPVDVSGVVLAVQMYATRRDVLEELSAAAGGMDWTTKVEIIRAAYLTLLVDKRVTPEERAKLEEIAAALQVPEPRLDAIIGKTRLPPE